MLCNEVKRLEVVLWQLVQQLLYLQHTFRLILNMIGRNHWFVQFYIQKTLIWCINILLPKTC